MQSDGEVCSDCGAPATWIYMPADNEAAYCDEHVPRGCSCWDDENGVEELAPDGRRQPCIEFEELTPPPKRSEP